MAIRSLVLLILLVTLVSAPVQACFGPKLFVAVGKQTQDEVMFALITLYVHEKTGVESTRVETSKDQKLIELLSDDKADLVLVPLGKGLDNVIFFVDGLSLLVTGKRPQQNLQFTTVIPAIRKLSKLLEYEAVMLLVSRVDAGQSPMAVARKFLMENRWI